MLAKAYVHKNNFTDKNRYLYCQLIESTGNEINRLLFAKGPPQALTERIFHILANRSLKNWLDPLRSDIYLSLYAVLEYFFCKKWPASSAAKAVFALF